MRLSHFVVTVPLLLCAAQFSQPFSLAQAAALDATQATELLAKTHALNVKCGILSSDQSQNLKDFVARAEISLAEKASVSMARKAIAGGKSQGKAAICDEAAKKLVNDVLAAATAAAVAPIEDQTVSEPAPAFAATATVESVPTTKSEEKAVAAVEPVVVQKPLKNIKLVNQASPAAKVKIAKFVKPEKPVKVIKPTKKLQSYASVAEKYYVATRCGSMSRSAIGALYKKVLVNHQQALANNRPSAVRAMLQSAESRASTKSCS